VSRHKDVSTVLSRAPLGLAAPLVRVEVHLGSGLPAFAMVGLPEAVVRESKERVRSALVTSGFVVFAQFALFLTIGMMLHAYYTTHPLPSMASNDEIFPAFIVRSLPHGIAGLVIAAVFAAAMSNLSGSLNSLASTTVLDFYQPLTGETDDARLLRLSRWLTAAWGIVLMAIAVLARGWGSVFTVGLTIASIVYGPMLGAFLLGVLTSTTTERGVIAGIGVSLVAMVAVRVFTPLAWTWYVLTGTAICVGISLVVSGFSRTSSGRTSV